MQNANHILILHQYYCFKGGTGNDRSAELAAFWARNGKKVSVITSTAYFPQKHLARKRLISFWNDNDVSVTCLNIPYRQSFPKWLKIISFLGFAVFAFIVALKYRRIDRVYACVTPPTVGWVAVALSWLKRIPFDLEVYDAWPQVPIGMGIIQDKTIINLIYLFINPIYDFAERIICLSPEMKEQLLEQKKEWAHKIKVSFNGTNIQRFKPPEERVAKPIRIIYAGAFGQANDIKTLIQIIPFIQERLTQKTEWYFYGWGSEWEECKNIAAQFPEAYTHHLAKFQNGRYDVTELSKMSLHFIPSISKQEIPHAFRAVHIGIVFFAPYKVLEANSANKFYDYLAAGLPVVLNYQGWQAQILEEYQAGFGAPQGNLSTFADNILKLVNNDELCIKYSINARNLALKYFDRQKLFVEL